MARGMFRDGRARPTFDTEVEFIPVNRADVDRSGGYGERRAATPARYGEWSAPEIDTGREGLAIRNFIPDTDAGHRCTATGPQAWFVENGTRVVIQSNDGIGGLDNYRVKTRPASETGTWRDSGTEDPAYLIADANRARTDPLAFPRVIAWTGANLPAYTPAAGDGDYAILLDTAQGQTLLAGRESVDDCLIWTRAWVPAEPGDPAPPANLTLRADVKDVAARESVLDGAVVATRTKSLVFAHAALKPLLDGEGSIAKEWKIRIEGKDLDITQVLDGWVPNRYVRIVAEDRR